MIAKTLLSFSAGELSPWLDSRVDLEKYGSGCRTLENFIVTPQGGLMKRPGMELLGALATGATAGRLVAFQISTASAALLAIGGGKVRVWLNGAAVMDGEDPLEMVAPWADGDLPLLRTRQVNDVLFLVHPDYPPQRIRRYSDASWVLDQPDYGADSPMLDANIREEWTITADFPAGATETAWSAAVVYDIGARVTYGGAHWIAVSPVPADADAYPGGTADWYNHLYSNWPQPDYQIAERRWIEALGPDLGPTGGEVALEASVDTWSASHEGSVWKLSKKRAADALRASQPLIASVNSLYGPVLEVQGEWTLTTDGSWYGDLTLQMSRDNGNSWENHRILSSLAAWPRNFSITGTTEARVLMRTTFFGTTENAGTSATLEVSDGYTHGFVRIDTVTDEKNATGTALTTLDQGTTPYWAEGAWSDAQGYPRAVELHQGRMVFAATAGKPHTLWGSAVDDYYNFSGGTDATDSYRHTLTIGDRDPILWLISDRYLMVGSGSAEFAVFGENENAPITPEAGTVRRQGSYGTHGGGAGAVVSDSTPLFVQRGGARVRDLVYALQSDRFESADLCLLAGHLFADDPIDDLAVQRMPFQIVWAVAGGNLFGLTYDRLQNVAGWHRHPTAGTVLSVEVTRTATAQDDVWLAVDRGDGPALERFRPGAMIDPQNDGWWLDSAIQGETEPEGLSYTATVQPLTVEVPLPNGTSRTRQMRIHAVVPSVWRSYGGQFGPALSRLSALNCDNTTGEVDKNFAGGHTPDGDLFIVSATNEPFNLRSITVKFNVYGD
jgi:hypothetical protein